MRKVKIIGVGLVIVVVATWSVFYITTPAEFRESKQAVDGCPGGIFDKSAVIFEAVTVCATTAVSQEKLEHAAQVVGEWLDNDEDAVPDDAGVLSSLKKHKATLVMSGSGFGLYGMKAFAALEAAGHFSQDLHAAETRPADGRRDASQEEIHHLIMGAGWMKVYPAVFSDTQEDSLAYKAWQKADQNQYYVYNDATCTTACKVMEFLYKSSAAYLGSVADLAETEFTIKSQQDLRAQLPEIVELYESDDYRYPRWQWPDGEYIHTDSYIAFSGLE